MEVKDRKDIDVKDTWNLESIYANNELWEEDYAALEKDAPMLKERFGSDVDVCVLLTGIGFKDMAVFDGRVSMPSSIENSVDAVIKRFS